MNYKESLVAQWERICLPMQETWVPSLIWEDFTRRAATEPVSHDYWAHAQEPRENLKLNLKSESCDVDLFGDFR